MEIEEKAKDFIEKFHNLEGILLKERKKSLFLLLHKNISLKHNEQVLQKINELLQPKSHLEEIYKLEFLIYFKRASDLLDILKSGNVLIANKIMRQPWFLKENFRKIEPKEFVQDIFPQLSVVIRAKILKQMLKHFKGNEKFMESLFDEILGTYGLEPALIIMSGCTIDKIKEILSCRKLNISKAQLKLLHDKDPSLISFYFEECYRRGGDMSKLGDFLVYLSKKDANLHVSLLLKYKVGYYNLGRRTARKYVAENKESILKEPQTYVDVIQFEKQICFKELGDEFPILFKAIFPKHLSILWYHQVKYLLNCYPKNKRYELYFNTFQHVYGKSLFEAKTYMFKELLNVIQDEDEREKWVEIFDSEDYIKYKRSSVAIAELKERLVRCDDNYFRRKLFEDIVDVCSLNRDYDELLSILKLFCYRFRNTDDIIIYAFLNSIYRSITLEELKEEHWKYIHEIIMIQNIRQLNLHTKIIFEYTIYLFKSGKSFEELIPIFLKSKGFHLTILKTKFKKFKEFSKLFLKLLIKYHSEVEEARDDVKKTAKIILAVRDWNKNYPNEIIIVHKQKHILDTIKRGVVEKWYYSIMVDSMKYLVCRENIPEEFIDIYFNLLYFMDNITIDLWFLKYKPNVLTENIDKIVICMNKWTNSISTKFLKKYEHNGLVKIITDFYLDKLKKTDEENADKIAKLLALIMTRIEFLKLLNEYVPTIDKLNLTESTEEERNVLKIQLAIAKSVRFSSCHMDALPVLLKYCRGDCSQSALHSLYKCFSATPENNLKPLIDILLKNSVSFRKHTVCLATMVFPVKINEDLCHKIMINDQNDSIQKHLFISSYKYFLKNPSELFWNILKNYMTRLTLYEKESLLLLTDVHVISDIYKDKFIKEVLKVFTELEKKRKNCMNEYYDKLMESIADDDIKFLSNDFCMNIICAKFFKETYKENTACMHFAIKCMMYGDDMRSNIRTVINILQDYKRKYCNSKEISVYVKSVIHSFFKKIMYKTMMTKEHRIFLPKEFVLILSDEWKKTFTLQDTLEEYIMLDFMILKYEENEDLTFYAKELNKLFKKLSNIFGDLIMPLVSQFLSNNLKYLLGDVYFELKLMELLSIILKYNSSLSTCLLVVQLLPKRYNDEVNPNFDYIMEVVKDKGELVQIYLNTYFKNQQYH